MLTDPLQDLSKAKFAALHGAANKLISFLCVDFDVEPVSTQKDIDSGKSDPFITVEEAVIIP